MNSNTLNESLVLIAKIFAEEFAKKLSEVIPKMDAKVVQPIPLSESQPKGARKRSAPPVEGTPGHRIIPVSMWNDYHPYPSVKSLRWMIFSSYKSHIDRCVVRVGRRVLIDEEKFFEWIKSGEAADWNASRRSTTTQISAKTIQKR